MSLPRPLLLTVWRDPAHAARLSASQWSTLVAQARHANVLGSLCVVLRRAGVTAPADAQRHLSGALQLSQRQHLSVRWEVQQLQQALGGLNVAVVLLKGAAYVMSAHALGQGRLFGDIDILVPRAKLGEVESQLMLNGWISAKTDDYDQLYYRQWMHEIPPMTHIRRSTVIDVHHTILPLTARHHPDPVQIIDRSLSLGDAGLVALRVPSPQDMVIHSLTHLMHEGELQNGLRDLCDIDGMLRQFAVMPDFWHALQRDAVDNDLAYPVQLGLCLVQRLLDTPVPVALQDVLQQAGGAPSPWLVSIYIAALTPSEEIDSQSWRAAVAQWLLYVRSHALRMPLRLVVPHLIRKAWMRRFPGKASNTAK